MRNPASYPTRRLEKPDKPEPLLGLSPTVSPHGDARRHHKFGSIIASASPWRKSSSRKASEASATAAAAEAAAAEVNSRRNSPGPSPRLHCAQCGCATVVGHCTDLGTIVRGYTQWRGKGDQALTELQECIDDMWLDELMLGCDTELFENVREVAAQIENGRDPSEVIPDATHRAQETESLAITSLRARLDARDKITLNGGLDGIENRIREQRAQAVKEVMPSIELLSDPGQAGTVRQAMDAKLAIAKEDFEEKNNMKTAKSEAMEVVVQLQDKAHKQEWMLKQLSTAVELLDSLFAVWDGASQDIQQFFVESAKCCSLDDPLRSRTVGCLQALHTWGLAAASACQDLVGRAANEGHVSSSSPVVGDARSCDSRADDARGDDNTGLAKSQDATDIAVDVGDVGTTLSPARRVVQEE